MSTNCDPRHNRKGTRAATPTAERCMRATRREDFGSTRQVARCDDTSNSQTFPRHAAIGFCRLAYGCSMPDTPFNFELTKAIEDHKAGLALFTQQQKLSVELASVIIRSMILVNGGAIVTILALVANLWTRNSDAARALAADMEAAVAWLATSLFLVLVSAFLTYLSVTAATHVISHQLLGRRETVWAKRHDGIRRAAYVMGILAFTAFGVGVSQAMLGFQ